MYSRDRAVPCCSFGCRGAVSHFFNDNDVPKKKNSVAFSPQVRPSDRRLSAKLVPTFADRGCRVVSATDSHGRLISVF
jgi:hypothetical protein